jgi:hypothetical protein
MYTKLSRVQNVHVASGVVTVRFYELVLLDAIGVDGSVEGFSGIRL